MLYSYAMTEPGHLRIGELSRRTDTSVELLRAWEKRYGLLDPDRSDGGFRLYSDDDVERVRTMQAHLADGLAAAEAARRALEQPVAETDGGQLVTQSRRELADALEQLRGGKGERRARPAARLAQPRRGVARRRAAVPARPRRGLVTRRDHRRAGAFRQQRPPRQAALGVGRGWGEGSGPHALLACPPREQHDLGLIAFGLALRNRGWRITYLGQDTPLSTSWRKRGELGPDRVVVAASASERLDDVAADLAALAQAAPLAIGGAGASAELAERAGATLLGGDPVSAAELLTREHRAGAPARR